MDLSTDVYSLAPSGASSRMLTHEQLTTYDRAVDAVIAADWPGARDLLATLPDDDPPSSFLRSLLQSADHTPPADWDGALSMAGKGEVRLRSG